MTAALLIAIIYVAIIWLVFFKLKLLKFSIGWGVASFWVGLHLVLAFVLGLRYVTPNWFGTPRLFNTPSSSSRASRSRHLLRQCWSRRVVP